MATLNVEGRQARTAFGRRRIGGPSGGLAFSEHGLAPQDAHEGCSTRQPQGRKYCSRPADAVQATKSGGKKTTLNNATTGGEKKPTQAPFGTGDVEDAASVQRSGKFGLKKVKPPEHTQKREGSKLNAGASAVTCEQRAKNLLSHALHQDPNMVPAETYQVAVEHGGYELLTLEQKVKHQLRVREFAHIAEQKRAEPAPNRAPPSAPSSLVASPFGTMTDTNNNEKGGTEQSSFHPSRRLLPGPESKEHVHGGKVIHASRREKQPTPFDTAEINSAYPDPPVVGSASLASVEQSRHGRRFLNTGDNYSNQDNVGRSMQQQQQQSQERGGNASLRNKDWDTVLAEKAARKAANRPAEGMPDFLFGCPPPPTSSKGKHMSENRTRGDTRSDFLDHDRSDKNSFGQAQSRTRAFAALKYKQTALW